MARQAVGRWAKKHPHPAQRSIPPPIVPEYPAEKKPAENPRTARRRLQRTSNPEVNYCDKTIRIPRRAYELAHGIRHRAIEKARAGLAIDIPIDLGLGRMVQRALQEFGENHDLLPLEVAR